MHHLTIYFYLLKLRQGKKVALKSNNKNMKKTNYYLKGKKQARRLRCLLGLHEMVLTGWTLKGPKEKVFNCEGCNRTTEIKTK